MHCDVSVESDVTKAVEAAIKQSGRVDVLCNNAAYISDWHNVVDATDEEWDRCYRITLRGASLFMKHAIPSMVRQKSGSVINISSVQGMVAARQSAAYTAIKHGLDRINTKCGMY